MPRIRTIKPEFWTSDQVVDCCRDARLLFIGMWNFCDDAGRFPASPRRLRSLVFPADELSDDDLRVLIAELVSCGLLVEYGVDGETYWQVSGWHRHQKVDRPNVKYPAPPGWEDAARIHRTNGERSPPEGKGREGKGSINPQKRTFADAFASFYRVYPRHRDKSAAAKAFDKAVLSLVNDRSKPAISNPDQAAAWLIERAKRYAKRTATTERQYVKYPATWLNRGSYDDEPDSQPKANGVAGRGDGMSDREALLGRLRMDVIRHTKLRDEDDIQRLVQERLRELESLQP